MCCFIQTSVKCVRVKSVNVKVCCFCQESGRESPSNQASSINGTDDEKISHVPDITELKSGNDQLKSVAEAEVLMTPDIP